MHREMTPLKMFALKDKISRKRSNDLNSTPRLFLMPQQEFLLNEPKISVTEQNVSLKQLECWKDKEISCCFNRIFLSWYMEYRNSC